MQLTFIIIMYRNTTDNNGSNASISSSSNIRNNESQTATKISSYGAIFGGQDEDNMCPVEYRHAEIKKELVRKLDLRMMLWGFFAYFANNLDRNNLRKLLSW